MRADARAKCWTALTNAACDQVSGDTDSGSPVYGWTCSASTPERSAFMRHHSSSARGRSRSSSERAVADLLCRDRVTLRVLVLAEGHGEVASGGQPGEHGRGREGMDAAPLLPEVERRGGQLRLRLAERRHEVGARAHQLAVERTN